MGVNEGNLLISNEISVIVYSTIQCSTIEIMI